MKGNHVPYRRANNLLSSNIAIIYTWQTKEKQPRTHVGNDETI